jgi:hypothetical protein
VKKSESDQIVIALRERNYPVQYLLAGDEGHGFQRPVNNMAMFAAGEKFLAQYLGGRYQATMTDEVAKRLGEITVDPKTVVMVKPAADPKTGLVLTKPADPGNSAGASIGGGWTWLVEAPGQQVEIALTLKEEGDNFSGDATSMIGPSTIEGGKINGKRITATLKANIQGQPMDFVVEGTLDGDKITGTITGGGFGSLPFTGTRAK